jgi:hypothetical protein
VWSVAVVLLAELPSVADGASVANSVVVFPAETRVLVGVGTKDEAFPVAFPVVAAAELASGC